MSRFFLVITFFGALGAVLFVGFLFSCFTMFLFGLGGYFLVAANDVAETPKIPKAKINFFIVFFILYHLRFSIFVVFYQQRYNNI